MVLFSGTNLGIFAQENTFLAVSLLYSFLANTRTSAAMVFALHFMGCQESKGDVLNKQDYPLHRTNTDTTI